YPQILNHREQHFTEAFGLRLGGAVEAQLVELADAVHEQRDVVAETLLDLAEGRGRIFEDVVQQCGLDRARVEVEAGEDLSNRYGMSDVGLAAASMLAVVNLSAELVGFGNSGQVLGGQVGA